MSLAKFEVFCCTCGIHKQGNTSGDMNPTTMCANCVDEKANFCCKCGIPLTKQSMALCRLCKIDLHESMK